MNSQFVVDGDDLKWMANGFFLLLLNISMEIFVLKPHGFNKLSHSSELRNDALMHCEDLKS